MEKEAVKVEDGIVVQKNSTGDKANKLGPGWVDVPSGTVTCGMFYDGKDFSLPTKGVTNADINTERSRRIKLPKAVDLGGGRTFRLDMNGGRANIDSVALMAVVKKSIADDTPIVFRDADNVDQSMTNDEMVSAALQVAQQVNAIYKASWVLKGMDPIPSDFEDASYWTDPD